MFIKIFFSVQVQTYFLLISVLNTLIMVFILIWIDDGYFLVIELDVYG